ncbi:recombinase RecA [Spiroplasma endosymbiont of Othius punctulatus]|uniref:recombinase RecA n=1 Tax=Spiroplasma endosymbiont of Othius punctulatus TaxID=3066289 RepID=UPI0030CCAD53
MNITKTKTKEDIIMPKDIFEDPDLKAVLKEIEKTHGRGSIMTLGDKADSKIEVISSGSLLLDDIIGVGGYPKGRVTEIFGPESSGKTTLALHAIAESQKEGGVAAFIDAEHSLDPAYAKRIGVDIDNLIVSQPDSGEQGLEILEALVKSGKVSIVIVDSVAALVPKAELDGEMSDQQIGAQARLMSKALRKVNGIINKTNTVVIFINQLREKVGIIFGNPEITPGGRALRFYSSLRLEVRKGETVLQNGIATGNKAKIKVVKNKVSPPFKTCQVLIIYNKGIDRMLEIIELAISKEIIDKAGSWFAYNGEKIGQGKDSVKEFLNSNPKALDEIYIKIKKNDIK